MFVRRSRYRALAAQLAETEKERDALADSVGKLTEALRDRSRPRTSTAADDEGILHMLAGASFGPGATVILPTGQRLNGDEAQALTAFYAPDADEKDCR